MARPDTWSDRARPGKLQHHSARGTMPRNAGDFTRGSQLITHEFLMWFASARPAIPGVVLHLPVHRFSRPRAAAPGTRSADDPDADLCRRMELHGVQQRARSSTSPCPRARSFPAPIGMVASHPDVVIAWNKLTRAVWGSLFISLFVALPLTVWFIDFSRKRRARPSSKSGTSAARCWSTAPELAAVNQRPQPRCA
jgi:hypothetical protein